jgi:hypothetical protein
MVEDMDNDELDDMNLPADLGSNSGGIYPEEWGY